MSRREKAKKLLKEKGITPTKYWFMGGHFPRELQEIVTEKENIPKSSMARLSIKGTYLAGAARIGGSAIGIDFLEGDFLENIPYVGETLHALVLGFGGYGVLNLLDATARKFYIKKTNRPIPTIPYHLIYLTGGPISRKILKKSKIKAGLPNERDISNI